MTAMSATLAFPLQRLKAVSRHLPIALEQMHKYKFDREPWAFGGKCITGRLHAGPLAG
jgi:hypothetical protein